MSVKSFVEIGLLSVSIVAVNVGSVFGWKCPEGHEHGKDEMCITTGTRFCDKCKELHKGYGVCPLEMFRVASDGIKIVVLPFDTPDERILALQREFGYETNGSKKDNVNPFYLKYDSSEVRRLNEYVQALTDRVSPKKVEDKKEGNGNLKPGATSDLSFDAEDPMRQEKKPVKLLRKKRNHGKKAPKETAEKIKDWKLLEKLMKEEFEGIKEAKKGKKAKKEEREF